MSNTGDRIAGKPNMVLSMHMSIWLPIHIANKKVMKVFLFGYP